VPAHAESQSGAGALFRSSVRLLPRDPAGARREIQKHIEDLRIGPAPDAEDSTVSSEARRPCAYNWLRGRDAA
jgi:hypothetical protein